MSDFLDFLLPSEARRTPKKPGVYKFVFRFPTDYELGLHVRSPDYERALRIVCTKLNRISATIWRRHLTGALSDDKQRHLRTRFHLIARSTTLIKPGALLEDAYEQCTSETELLDLLEALRLLARSIPPLYIGITTERTLNVRLNEHLDGATALFEQIEKCNLSWNDTRFQCVPLASGHRLLSRKAEQILQVLHRPVFSKA